MAQPPALTEWDLEGFCARHGVPARLHHLDVPTPTVPDAAKAVGTEPAQIVKSLVFMAREEPLLVVAAGESRVSYPALATVLGVSRKQLRFATPDEALLITGFRVGAMPPFGHRVELPTWLDALTVPETGSVFAGGGGVSALLELDAAVLHEVTGGRRVPLTRADEA